MLYIITLLIPWRRKYQPTPVLLPRKLQGWRSLVSYSPWSCKESDTTEQLSLTQSLTNRKDNPCFPTRPLPVVNACFKCTYMSDKASPYSVVIS